jgi:hypothetical protein
MTINELEQCIEYLKQYNYRSFLIFFVNLTYRENYNDFERMIKYIYIDVPAMRNELINIIKNSYPSYMEYIEKLKVLL